MYKQIYHNLIICCINDNIVKLFLGMFKYKSTTRYLLFDVQCCQSVNRSMIRYVGRLDNYVNCITCRDVLATAWRFTSRIRTYCI